MINADRILRTVAVLGVLIASNLAIAVARPIPAEAAYPHCNGDHYFAGQTTLPVFFFGFSPVKDCILTRGDGYGNAGEEDAVVALQWSLATCNNARVASDGLGNYGPATEAAVTWIQAVSSITADGDYGPQTRRVLLWSYRTSDGKLGCRRVP